MKKNWKKISLISLAILMAMSLVSVATLALFTDAISLGGKITAGTMDLTTNDALSIEVTNMQPGLTKSFVWNLTNSGSVNGVITGGSYSFTQSEGVQTGPELATPDGDSTGDLTDVLKIQAYIDGVPQFPDWMPITGITASGNFNWGKAVNAGATTRLEIQVKWPEGDTSGADNVAQGDILEGTVNFNFVQAH